MDTEFLTVQDVARRIGVGAARVRQLANTGQLRVAARTSSGERLFDPATVEDFARLRAERTRTRKAI